MWAKRSKPKIFWSSELVSQETIEQGIAEREWSGQWVKSATHSLLQANIALDIVHFLKGHLKDR